MMANDSQNTGPVQVAQHLAAQEEMPNMWPSKGNGRHRDGTPKPLRRVTTLVNPCDRISLHTTPKLGAQRKPLRRVIYMHHASCPCLSSRGLDTPVPPHDRQCRGSLLAPAAFLRRHQSTHLRRTSSAVPGTRQHKLTGSIASNRCYYSKWPLFDNSQSLSRGNQGNMTRRETNGCWRASQQQILSKTATQQNHALSEESVTPLSNLKSACAALVPGHEATQLMYSRKQRANHRVFFCSLMLAACLCSLLCLFLLRHKHANPLTQALLLLATQKELAVKHMRRLATAYKEEQLLLVNVPFLGRLFFQTIPSYFSKPQVAARLNTGTAVSRSQRAVSASSGFTRLSADTDAAHDGVMSKQVDLYMATTSDAQSPADAHSAFTGGLGAQLMGTEHRLIGFPSTSRAGLGTDVDHPLQVDAEDEVTFQGAATPDEFRQALLAEGGWTYIPHTRHNLPIDLPATLPALPRSGGGRFLRRHHAPDTPPALPWALPAITADQALRSGRQLMSAEAYREAASVLQHAVRDGHLTRAVRLHGQFLYPWKLFSNEEREALRLLADQVRWFPKWVKNHRHSQRIDKSVLDLHLPVVQPQFADRYGGPGSPSANLSQGVRFTWLGHAAAVVNIDGLKVLLDPMFDHDLIGSYNEWLRSVVMYVNSFCGSLGRRHRQPPCSYDDLPADIDVVVLSHNHQDHIMENDVETLCRRRSDKFKKLIWYVPEGVSSFLRQYGCASSNIFEFTWGERRTLSCHTRTGRRMCVDGVWKKERALVETYEITFSAGLHWSGRTASKTDHNASLWGGYAINGPRHKFYYAGDTAYWRPDFDEFRKIGEILGPFHLAALPIGAYEPNEDLRYQHVNPHETLRLFKDLRAEVAIGVHWGTLRLSAEEFFDPMLDLECALLGLAREDCHRTSALRHRYKATEVFLRHYSTRPAKQPHSLSHTPPPSTASQKKRKQRTEEDDDRSTKSRITTSETAGPVNSTASVRHAGQGKSTGAGGTSGASTKVEHDERSRTRKTSALKRSKLLSPTNAAENAEFENLVQDVQALMLPMADTVSNASNFQRLLRSLKLEEAGMLPRTRAWKDNLLKEGARFQTLFVGQSIQVESSENGDFIWMSRSSGLQHILDNAPDEQYIFTPMHSDNAKNSQLYAKSQNAEYFPSPTQALSPSAIQDAYRNNSPAVLM